MPVPEPSDFSQEVHEIGRILHSLIAISWASKLYSIRHPCVVALTYVTSSFRVLSRIISRASSEPLESDSARPVFTA